MGITFDGLCAELHLKPTYKHEEQLRIVKDWCYKHVSKDIRYDGDSEQTYTKYLALIKKYLDGFLNQLTANISYLIPQLDQMNAIQYAAQQGYDRFISSQTSLSDGFVNESNPFGMTPLHICAVKGYVNTLKALLAKGANPLASNKESQLPIYCALFVPILHDKKLITQKETIFKLLYAAAPGTLGHKDNSGNSVFHLMAAHGFDALLAEVLAVDSQGAFYNNNYSQYPIHTAILNNQPNIARLLLSIDKVATLGDEKNRVALHYVARYGTERTVQDCIRVTENINVRDKEYKTPLILAAEAQNIEALQTLVKNSADTTLVDYLG